jgi:hypothetical protein
MNDEPGANLGLEVPALRNNDYMWQHFVTGSNFWYAWEKARNST